MLNHLIFILFISISSMCFSSLHSESESLVALERRAAIDVGSGGTKLIIADVDVEANKIMTVFLEKSFSVGYQASLDKSEDGTFDEEVKSLGLKTFHEIKEISEDYQVEKIVAVATSAFRKSNNARQFVEEIKEKTGIKVEIILQQEEGEIAFYSAIATGEFDPEEAIVWDIGTGSMQITTLNTSNGLTVYMGEQVGSVAFKSYIIDIIQKKGLGFTNSPNPISSPDLKAADSYVRSFGRKAYPLIKTKIKNESPVVGIGRLFYNSIRPLASENGVITRKGLRAFINSSLNKTDEELNNPFAHVDVSNCILTLAVMKSLHIHEIYPVDTTAVKGLLIYHSYWK